MGKLMKKARASEKIKTGIVPTISPGKILSGNRENLRLIRHRENKIIIT